MGTQRKAAAWLGWQGKTIFFSCAVIAACGLTFAFEVMAGLQ